MKRSFPTSIVLLLVLIITVGCTSPGRDPEPEPTLEPTATIPPTLTPGGTSVGDLVNRTQAAWGGVTSMRTTFWTGSAGDLATPATTGSFTTEITVLPNARHVIQTVDGQVVDEQITVGGRVYMKGSMVVAAIAPMIGPDTWVEVDPAAATSNSPIAMQIAYLTAPVTSPFATVSPETLALEAFPAGEITVGDRSCRAYTFGAAAGTGIQYELSLDADDLPCRMMLTSGDIANVTIYEFNVPGLGIAVPDIATPEPAP